MSFLSETIYNGGIKFLQINYESYDCDLTHDFLFMV